MTACPTSNTEILFFERIAVTALVIPGLSGPEIFIKIILFIKYL